MSDKPPPATHLRAVPGTGTPSTAVPRPALHPQISDTDTLMRALNEAQGKIMTLENLTRSQEIEIAELRSAKSTLIDENKRLIVSDISLAAKRIIRTQGEEIRAFRTSLRDAQDLAEADRLELDNVKKEYEKLLEAFEERLSAESIVEMLHEQLVIVEREAQDAKTDLINLQSGMSVRNMFMDELADLKAKLEKIDKLMLSDLSSDSYRAIVDLLSGISVSWMQTDDPKKQADGFKLQTNILEQWSTRRPI